jgi:hypothetical protein
MSEQNFQERARQIFDENYKLEDNKTKPKLEAIPRGEYICRTKKGNFFRSSQKQTPGYKITFQIAEGDYRGRLLWCDIWLTPKCKGRSRRAFDELGIDDINDELDNNRTYIVDVDQDEYNNVVRNKVEDFQRQH